MREHIQKLNLYNPPLKGRGDKDYLLLDFNEKTTGPSPKVQEALRTFIDSDRLHIYPEYGDLEAKIAQYAKVKADQVMVTNGADQAIDIICRAYLAKGDKVIIPSPAFAMHYQSASIQGAEILEPKYKEDGSFPLKETLELISKGVRLIILCNPNNPIGTLISIEEVERILSKAKEKAVAVLHDEAYFEFSGLTSKGLIEKYDNLYVVRTFAKAFGLVSTRAGYVISQKDNIRELLKIRGPYDVNMFAKVAIVAALGDIQYTKDYVREVMEESKPRLESFLKEKGIFFYPSSANFLLLQLANPEKTISDLKSKGILVRPKKGPSGQKAIRVSIGTLRDTERFCEAYTQSWGD